MHTNLQLEENEYTKAVVTISSVRASVAAAHAGRRVQSEMYNRHIILPAP